MSTPRNDAAPQGLRHFLSRWLPSEPVRLFVRLLPVCARAFMRKNGPTWAAAIAYYSLLSVFPLLLAAGSVASFFIDPQKAVLQVTAFLGDYLPRGRMAIESIVKESLEGGGLGILFILPMIWTGTLVFGALTKALNVAFESGSERGYLRQVKVRLMMLLSLGVIFLLALASSPLLHAMHAVLGVLPLGSAFVESVLLKVAPVVLLLIGFLLTYRFVPARRPGWRAAALGAVIASVIFVVAKPLFLGYVQVLARHNFVYGSLAGIIAVVIWSWVVSMIGIFGGQMACLCQSVIFEGQPFDEVARRHLATRRGHRH